MPKTSMSEDLEPAYVGQYNFEKNIGQGTYGKVKLAIHSETGEKVAIKMIEKQQIKSAKQITRLQREIRFLKLLHHPHIVKVHDVVETAEYIFIIMEYVEHGELFDYIVAKKRVKEREARSFFRQVLSAVSYCHQNAVIHRDLKPENLLLDEKMRIKIIDFGFGNNFKPEKWLDTFCGSPFYASPEMIMGKKYEGPEVDIWSLGIVLFALLCGHLPFDDDDIKELYKKISAGAFQCPDFLSDKAKDLLSKLIKVDRYERATLDQVMNHPWVNEGYITPPETYFPIRPTTIEPSEINLDIVHRMKAFGYTYSDVEAAFSPEIDHSKADPVRSTYFLLIEMLEREKAKKLVEQDSETSLTTVKGLNVNGELSQSVAQRLNIQPRMSDNQMRGKSMDRLGSRTDIVDSKMTLDGDMGTRGSLCISRTRQRMSSKPPPPSPLQSPALSEIRVSETERKNPLIRSASRFKEEIRNSVTGWLLSSITTSTKPLPMILHSIVSVLVKNNISHQFENGQTLLCELRPSHETELPKVGPPLPKKQPVMFQIIIYKTRTESHEIHFKRIQGGLWNYKRLIQYLLSEIEL